jgi:hypothetical protein
MNNPHSTELVFELSHAGRRCHGLPPCNVLEVGVIESRSR